MKAFISYSTREKEHGARIKGILDSLQVDSFLAHEDLEVSEVWRRRILAEVSSCEIFIPLLSQAFKQSDWCGQETGIIVKRRGVLILPLSIDGSVPYGFISHIQGHLLKGNDEDKSVIIDSIGQRWPEKMIDVLMPTMQRVYSFRQAESVMEPFSRFFPYFNVEQANTFARLCAANGQIWGAHDCSQKYLPDFLRHNVAKLEAQTAEVLTFQVEHQRWHEKRIA